MHEAYRTEGVVTDMGTIDTPDLPFEKGQRVELVVWPSTQLNERPSPEEIARRLAGLDELEKWFDNNRGKDRPVLSDADISRESIYEDRGL